MNINRTVRRFTIRTRMLAGVGLITVTLLAIGGVGLAAQIHARTVNRTFVAEDFTAMRHIADLRHAMGQMRSHEKDMIIQYEHPEAVTGANEAWKVALADIEREAAAVSAALHSAQQRDEVARAMAHMEKFKNAFIPVGKQLQQQGFDSARVAAAFMERARADYDQAQSVVEALSATLNEQARASAQRVESTADVVMSVLAGSVAFALAVITPLTLLNMRSICRPVRQAEALADAIARGDLAERHIDDDGRDETARLLRALKAMQASLRGIVGQVRNSADSISLASTDIATGNLDLSSRTEHAARNLQRTASSMDRLTGTVKQSAESARQADQLAMSAAKVAARGGDVVSKVVATMNDIDASSKRIVDIIAVIDGIAFQTNILALNAAVEAARAGEQGRGFAVVAGEVRALAQRSAQAAKEVNALIGDSVEKVGSGAKLVADAGHTMHEIVQSVQCVTAIIGEITAAAAHQSEGIGQINDSVVMLEQVTQQNATLVEQSAAASESLKEQTQRLVAAVGVFRIESAAS